MIGGPRWRAAALLAAAGLLFVTTIALRGGQESDATQSGRPRDGTLVIIGGGLRYSNADVWNRIVQAAGGKEAEIAVLGVASLHPEKAGAGIKRVLEKYGAKAFIVPAKPDEAAIERVRNSGGVYFTGGQQSRITALLHGPDGKNTPLLEAIWDVYRRGGLIAGSSAGAAVMSRIMYRHADFVLPTLLNGVQMGREIDRGLGFLDADWFVDQHFIARGRFGRALSAMNSQGFKYGLGVDEDTAIVITHSGGKGEHRAEVVGYSGAIFIDLSAATRDPAIAEFNLKNVRFSYLDRGDSIVLETREVTPSPEKLADFKIDPNAPNFIPEPEEPLFYNDIFSSSTLIEVMCKLIDNKKSEATGLAFDGPAAMNESARGFELRFYRDKDSVGWSTGAYGGETYTVLNLHVDVRPIRMAGPPLYR